MTLQDWLDQTKIQPLIEPNERRSAIVIVIDINDVMRKVLWTLSDYNVVSVNRAGGIILMPKPLTPAMKPPKPNKRISINDPLISAVLLLRLLSRDGKRRG